MNNKSKLEKPEITVGQRLLQARQKLGFSQEIIAERLCLKVCTVREIEEENHSSSVDPTFLRGYIRAYAKLVKIPEEEIIELLDKYTPTKLSIISPMQSYSIGIRNKKQESWLIKFTWFIVTICVTIIAVWWWKDYKIHKQEIINIAKHNSSNNINAPLDLPFSIINRVVSKQSYITTSEIKII